VISLIYIAAAVSLVGVLYVVWEYVQGYRCAKWPSTKGDIVQSELGLMPGNRKEKVPYIYYRYVVNGKTHYSRRIAMYVANLLSNVEAEKLRGQYLVNKEVVVRYHPIFNGFAVLETGQRQTLLRVFLLLIFLSVFLVSMAAIFGSGFNPLFDAITWVVG
jgi:hypothetical protein